MSVASPAFTLSAHSAKPRNMFVLTVTAVDHQHLGLDPGDRPQRLADLLGLLDLIVENIRMLGAEAADTR